MKSRVRGLIKNIATIGLIKNIATIGICGGLLITMQMLGK